MAKDVETTMCYWHDRGDGSLPNAEKYKEILLGHLDEEKHKVIVKDIRGTESDYSIDIHGFEVHKLQARERIVSDLEVVKTEYFDEISQFLKDMLVNLSLLYVTLTKVASTGAKHAVIGGLIQRAFARDALAPQEFIPGKVQAPSPRPHVDIAPESAESFANRLTPEAAAMIRASSRWQILGIWKPVKNIQRDPLIFADWRSIPSSDYCLLERYDREDPRMNTASSMLKFGKEHSWFYCSDMTPDEVVVFKHFDSKRDGKAWRCAHTSLAVPGTEDLPARESIEVRALVCY